MPARARRYIGRSVRSRSPSRTTPASGCTRPTTIENVVVLPAPLGPSSPTISPDGDLERDVAHDGSARCRT